MSVSAPSRKRSSEARPVEAQGTSSVSAPERYPAFDLLRIIAACMVILSHSFALLGLHEPVAVAVGNNRMTWGAVGVAVFFTTSGFLLVISWMRDSSPTRFVIRRVLRIWPAFLVVIGVTALVVGPMVSSEGLWAYLTSKHTWSYIGHNALMSPIQYGLPGVFQGQSFTAVNGSLWTLPYEVVAYLGLLALGVASLIRSRVLLGLFVLTAAVVSLGVTSDVVKIPNARFNDLSVKLFLWLGLWFLGGACLALYRSLIVQRFASGVAAVCGCIVGAALHQVFLFVPALCVLIVFLGTLPSGRLVPTRFGDPSYGLYLYAFPVQQLLVKAGVWHHSPWALFGTSGLVTAAVAFASWHFIEHPANKLRHRFASGQTATLRS